MPRHAIIDEFTALTVSPQRKWQLRRRKARLCIVCSAPAVNATHCDNCRVKFNRIVAGKSLNRALSEAGC